jgi:hypothetical protein
MKILCIICGHKYEQVQKENILILKNYLDTLEAQVDYAAISSENDFHVFEDIVSFKYKSISKRFQMSKMCDFMSSNELDYDWYIKCRPDLKLLEQPFNLNVLKENAINARARVYYGNKNIKHGLSVGGQGVWKHRTPYYYSNSERPILDDMIYIFDKNVFKNGAFFKINNTKTRENEWFHTNVWQSRKIKLNVIGLHLIFTKNNTYSGDILVENRKNYNKLAVLVLLIILSILLFLSSSRYFNYRGRGISSGNQRSVVL